VTALRRYLWRFRLPGESAQIERILEGFARGYFAANPPGPKPLSGWYVQQPSGERCCMQCGSTADKGRGEKDWLKPCSGCQCVYFCRQCRKKLRVEEGHAIGGVMGYGRACVAAKRATGQLTADGVFTYTDAYGKSVNEALPDGAPTWVRGSPFRSEDSVMVLAYAIIMLTTNLHSEKVKQKMRKHEFLGQNKGVNDGRCFPGDFLSEVYDDIAARELEVMK